MKFEIESVDCMAEDTIELYSKKVKPYQMKLETIEGHKVVTIELKTLEDLLKLSNKVRHSLVFNDGSIHNNVNLTHITIYDDYLE